MGDENPIIDEVRAIRDALARKYDYDLARIVAALREVDEQPGQPSPVRLPPRAPVVVRKAS